MIAIAAVCILIPALLLYWLSTRRRDGQCPVCKSVLKYTSEGDSITEEMSEECTECNFLHEFAYGAYRTRIGNRTWEWSWDADDTELEQIKAEMYAAIKG